MANAVQMLYQINTVWKQDLMLYIRCMAGGRRQTASTIMKSMISSGLAEEFAPLDPSAMTAKKMSPEGSYSDSIISGIYRKLPEGESSSGYSLIRITEKGAVYLDERVHVTEKNYFRSNLTRFAGRFSSVITQTVIHELTQSRVMCMAACGHAAVFNWEKPAPLTLFDCFAEQGNSYLEKLRRTGVPVYRMAGTMPQRMERSKIIELLGGYTDKYFHGVYYQLSDIRELLKQLGTGSEDRFNGSVCYGVIVSMCGIWCVFSETPGIQRFVNVNITFEESLRQSLYQLFGRIPMIQSQESVASVLICNGTSRIPAVMMGIKDARVRRIYDPKKEKYALPDADTGLAPVKTLITYNTALPGKIWLIPANEDGAEMLKGLLAATDRGISERSRLLISKNPERFVPNPLNARMNEYVYGTEKAADGYPVVYLPFPEIGMLRAVSTQYRSGCALILSCPGVADAISRAVRIPVRFYCTDDESDKVRRMPDAVRYTRYGYPIRQDGSYDMPEPIRRNRGDHSAYQPHAKPYGKALADVPKRIFIRATAGQRDAYLAASSALGVSMSEWITSVLDSHAVQVIEERKNAVRQAQKRKKE